jgi:hypothetical protein
MYLYFMPVLEDRANGHLIQDIPAKGELEQGQVPASDGGIEIMEARFLPAHRWLQMARSGDISLFPPQFLLLHLVSQFLDGEPLQDVSPGALEYRRRALLNFVYSGNPQWTEKYISPNPIKVLPDKRIMLELDKPGPELRGSGKEGVKDMVIVARFKSDGPQEVEVRWRKDIIADVSKSAL